MVGGVHYDMASTDLVSNRKACHASTHRDASKVF
jgi:hypothetical protein